MVLEHGYSNKNELGNWNVDSKIEKLETHVNVENANGSRRYASVFERKLSDRGEEEQFEFYTGYCRIVLR